MESPASIPGIGQASLELLEAAGFNTVESIASAQVDVLTEELRKANSVLGISKRPPGLARVASWIEHARERFEETEVEAEVENEVADEEPVVQLVNYEESEQVASMLAVAPFAIPLPAKVLMQNRLAVSDIPPGILLNRYSGDLDVRVEERIPRSRETGGAPVSGAVSLADDPRDQQKLKIDVSKVRSMDEMAEPLQKMPSVKVSPSNDRVALLRAPRSETNKGKDPKSRWYIRGVLHSHPVSVYVGALVTVVVMLWVPVSVIAAALLFLSGEYAEKFDWVPGWLLVFPVALPLLGIAYLIWGLHGSCRICGQRLFVHRSHLKNVRAHHVKGLGYILPLCIQILIFRWFRCTHCGTPVRLKE